MRNPESFGSSNHSGPPEERALVAARELLIQPASETMKRTTSISTVATCAAGIAAVLLSSCTSAVQRNKDDKKGMTFPYNPYPPGILPADLNSEVERVLR